MATPTHWICQIPRYLAAVEQRLASLDCPQDTVHRQQVASCWQRYLQLRAEEGASQRVVQLRWMVEEYRVSLFAPGMTTLAPFSPEFLDTLCRDP